MLVHNDLFFFVDENWGGGGCFQGAGVELDVVPASRSARAGRRPPRCSGAELRDKNHQVQVERALLCILFSQ